MPLHRRRRQEGQTLILVALLMVAMMVMVGIVLDYGLVRTDRQKNKSAADFAVTAGLQGLENPDGVPRSWQGACEAFRYLVVNSKELSSLTGTWKTGEGLAAPVPDPCPATGPAFNGKCEANKKSSWAWFDGSADGGRIKVDIKSGYDLSDGSFAEESLTSGDGGDPAQGNCDHLAVIISEDQKAGFGALSGVTDLSSRIRSVGRVVVGTQGDATVALLLLERNDCKVVDIQGTSGARVISGGNADRPGIIHADSLGNGLDCSGTDKIMNGNFGDPPEGPRILAEKAETPVGAEAPGIIGIVALSGAPGAVPANAYDPCPSTVEAQPGLCPTGRDQVGRAPVDARYLKPMVDLKAGASTLMNWSAGQAASAGFTVLDCSLAPVGGGSAADQKIFVDCSGGVNVTSSFEFSGVDSQIVFNGPLTVGGGPGTTLTFKDTRHLYVKGSAANGVSLTRNIQVNTNGTLNCDARFTQDRTKSTKFVIGSGPLASIGNGGLTMCQTMLFMMDGTLPASDGVAPYSNGFQGRLDVAGNGGLDWSAPNVTSETPTSAQLEQFEDLAFWTETEALKTGTDPYSKVEGNGAITMKGVFFLPNANPFRVAGKGVQNIELAQFISRKLEVAGNGFLNLRPDPADVVPIPYFADFTLVR